MDSYFVQFEKKSHSVPFGLKKMRFKKNVEATLKTWNKEYKKGFFSYIILLLLNDRALYGIEINNKLLEITDCKVTFQESGTYHILKKLEESGFIKGTWQKSKKGPKRKYYIITESGEQLLKVFTESYILPINKAVNNLLSKHFPNLC